jgi:hypothetical protein
MKCYQCFKGQNSEYNSRVFFFKSAIATTGQLRRLLMANLGILEILPHACACFPAGGSGDGFGGEMRGTSRKSSGLTGGKKRNRRAKATAPFVQRRNDYDNTCDTSTLKKQRVSQTTILKTPSIRPTFSLDLELSHRRNAAILPPFI